MHVKIAMLGFGNVGRALAQLLLRKADVLQRDFGVTFSVTGIATNSKGIVVNPEGLDLREALALVEAKQSLATLHVGTPILDTLDMIGACPADVVMEATWLNPRTGQPATDYVHAALQAGRHVVTANKGPVAYALREMQALAADKDRGFFFESTVMDGAPVLAIGRESLLAATIHRVRGVLNSTTNYVLTCLENGIPLDEAVSQAQKIGVAEADPATDLEGWDSAVKTVVLANVLMGANLRPGDVDRTGITAITPADAQEALANNERIKLICEAIRQGNEVRASVRPMRLPMSDPLSQVSRTSSAVTIEMDTLHQLTIVEGDTDPTTTAFGMLVDMLNILRGRYHSRLTR